MNEWRDLVDLPRLAAWMESRGLGAGSIEDVTPLTGGTQNVLLKFRRGAREFVLRRPPAHPVLDGSQTMRREARVLQALAGGHVPHPELIAACDDKEVLGASFYLMAPVVGYSPTVELPATVAADPLARRAMGFAMIDALIDLGRVDYRAAGLADFGKLDNYIERQAARWRGQLDSYHTFALWPGPAALNGLGVIESWLAAHRPATFQPAIVHGDYSLGNMMFRHDQIALAAIVDWELATLGDPLTDLGWLLATWPDPDGAPLIPKLGVTPWQGFPRAEELVARYGERSGRDMSTARWFCVLACYKLGILLEGTFARACAGKAPKELGDTLHMAALKVFARALNMIEASQ